MRARYLDDRNTDLIPGSDLAVMLLSPGYMTAWTIGTPTHTTDIAAWEVPEWMRTHRKWWQIWKPRWKPTGYQRGGMMLPPGASLELTEPNADGEFEAAISSQSCTWRHSTITAEAFVVYQVSTGTLIYIADFDCVVRSTKANFTIEWPKLPLTWGLPMKETAA